MNGIMNKNINSGLTAIFRFIGLYMNIKEIVRSQKDFFATGATINVNFRIEALQKLRENIQRMESDIYSALKTDLNKCKNEAYMTEIGLVYNEIRYMLKNIKKLASVHKAYTPVSLFPAKSRTLYSPYGTVLIMSPWNYPFMLSIVPLVDAVAAGNTAIIKPSGYSKATSTVIKEIISNTFGAEYVAVTEGGRDKNATLLDETYDFIFFTGGEKTGRLIMSKAAKNLTPVCLELGGKSPAIVDESADIKLAAKRIVFGKFTNSGQTCVAPDYVLVHESKYYSLLESLKKEISFQYTDDPLSNDEYSRIISKKHFDRLISLLENGRIYYGGGYDSKRLIIEPSVLTGINFESPVMKQEIFGPLLPVLSYKTENDLIDLLKKEPDPLALYIFTENRYFKEKLLRYVQYGGGCVNDTLVHLSNNSLPFGGVGQSGIGNYHGKYGFETFSHIKGIVQKGRWPDISARYGPYTDKKFKLIKRFLK